LQKRVREEQGDSLGLLIVVAGHGAFVAAFGNRAEVNLRGYATLGTIGFEGRFDYAAIGTVSMLPLGYAMKRSQDKS
jgi:hypothetical protein